MSFCKLILMLAHRPTLAWYGRGLCTSGRTTGQCSDLSMLGSCRYTGITYFFDRRCIVCWPLQSHSANLFPCSPLSLPPTLSLCFSLLYFPSSLHPFLQLQEKCEYMSLCIWCNLHQCVFLVRSACETHVCTNFDCDSKCLCHVFL